MSLLRVAAEISPGEIHKHSGDHTSNLRQILVALVVVGSHSCAVFELSAADVGPKREDLGKARARAINFLKTSQLEEGTWTTTQSPGISALATYALLINHVPANDQGMFCRHDLFSKAMATLDIDYPVDDKGQSHDWWKELAEQAHAAKRHWCLAA